MRIDKYLAVSNLSRVPEKVFWLLAASGGSLGGLVGIYFFRHKTKKIDFILKILAAVVGQAGVIYLILQTSN